MRNLTGDYDECPFRVIFDRERPPAYPAMSAVPPKAEVKSGYWHLSQRAVAG